MKIFNPYSSRPNVVYEEISSESITEIDTYIPVHKQLNAMISAGERLQKNRRLYYDSELEEFDDESCLFSERDNLDSDIIDYQEYMARSESSSVDSLSQAENDRKEKTSRKKVKVTPEVKKEEEIDASVVESEEST